jgi:hypothetical protein
VQEWELDDSLPCPYDLPEESECSQLLYQIWLMLLLTNSGHPGGCEEEALRGRTREDNKG